MGAARAIVILVLCGSVGFASACNRSPPETVADAGMPAPDTGISGGADACASPGPDCYPTPLPPDASSLMILNACTDAQAFDPAPQLPLLGRCGKLPALP